MEELLSPGDESSALITATSLPEKTQGRTQAVAVYKVALVREAIIRTDLRILRSSLDVAKLLHAYLDGVDREHFVVFMMNQRNEVIGINTVSIGSLTASVVTPREVFKPAILANSASIICGHNHPGGDPAPSTEDRTFTDRLVGAGKLLGIPMRDHVIIGDGTERHYSFADAGQIE